MKYPQLALAAIITATASSGAWAQTASQNSSSQTNNKQELDIEMFIADESDTSGDVVNLIALPAAAQGIDSNSAIVIEPTINTNSEVNGNIEIEVQSTIQTIESELNDTIDNTSQAVTDTINDAISSGDLGSLPRNVIDDLPIEVIDELIDSGVTDAIDDLVDDNLIDDLDSDLLNSNSLDSNSGMEEIGSDLNSELTNGLTDDIETNTDINNALESQLEVDMEPVTPELDTLNQASDNLAL